MKRLLILSVLTTVAWEVRSGTIHVPADQPTIQAGIYAAVDGDTVLVAPGTYSGTGNRNIDFDGKGILVLSEFGPDSTTVDCAGPYRAFLIWQDEDSSTVIDGFTITGATLGGYDSAAVMCDRTSPTIRNCIITNNSCDGFYGFEASPRVENCLFSYNRAGFRVQAGYTRIADCEFSFNDTNGVAVEWSGAIEMTGCLLRENGASGLWIYTLVDPFHISNCTFYGNRRGFYYAVNFPKDGSYSEDSRLDSLHLENCIAAFNLDVGIEAEFADPHEVVCCNAYGNPGGDFVPRGPLQFGPGDEYGNISLAPLLCDTAAGNFHVSEDSPCAPANNSCGVLIGAFPVGCDCCIQPIRGNVDYDPGDLVNIADVSFTVQYVFFQGTAPPCFEEGDVNADGVGPDIVDLAYLVAYLFGGGPPPQPCP